MEERVAVEAEMDIIIGGRESHHHHLTQAVVLIHDLTFLTNQIPLIQIHPDLLHAIVTVVIDIHILHPVHPILIIPPIL